MSVQFGKCLLASKFWVRVDAKVSAQFGLVGVCASFSETRGIIGAGAGQLEVDQVAHVYLKGIGQAAQDVEADVDGAVFDLPNVRLVRADHQGKLALGQPLLLP